VDNYHCSLGSLASWRFWGEDQPQVAKNRQLDPYSDCTRDHSRCFESAWNLVTVSRFRKLKSCLSGYGYRLNRQAWLSAAWSLYPGSRRVDGLAMKNKLIKRSR
jgi:hypothetical protein